MNYSTYQGSHVQKTGISLWWDDFPHINVSSHFAGTFLFIKYMCDIFKNCRKAFSGKRNRNGSQINEPVEQ